MAPPTSWRELELVCPACHGPLETRPKSKRARTEPQLVCDDCDTSYPVILDIPDLRTRPDPYIGFDEDRAKGRKLAEECAGLEFAEALKVYYRQTEVVTESQAAAFIASVLAAEGRAHETLAAIESEHGLADGPLLDLGCGTAPLALDAVERYPSVVGVDIAFRWLVMAKIRLETAGVRLPLICACAEALPFPDRVFARVVGESVVEHLEDQGQGLRETTRVMQLGADIHLTTPNRFSLGPDPHVGLLAGGYLPNRVIAAYIRKKGGIPPRRRLYSDRALRRQMWEAGLRDVSIEVPRLAEDRLAALDGLMKKAASAYQASTGIAPLRLILRKIGPLLSASATKPHKLGPVR